LAPYEWTVTATYGALLDILPRKSQPVSELIAMRAARARLFAEA
jgi:hypothetical protein